ncbi:MAG: aminotransferase class III-fold pyridoxal phosphate-dependent enzyme [Fibrobacterales bacterium]
MKHSKIEKSFKLQEKAKQIIPGLCQLLSKRPDQFSWGVWPGYFSKAKGVQVWDLDGNEYTDMSIGGIGATVLGYADSDVDTAVKLAIDAGVATSLNCAEEVELAELLCSIHPWSHMCRFTRTGGEAMSVAVRIARAHTGKDNIAFCGYHGWHDWYLSANVGTENALGEHLLSGLEPLGVPRSLKGTTFPFRYNHIEELEKIIEQHGDELGAIVMEPIRGAAPENNFLQKVRALADTFGIVFIVDEISAGFRLNSGGAHLKLGVEPDIAVFSKGIGNGYAIGAIVGKGNVMESAQKTFISSTNWTERVGFAAAIATITKFERCNVSEHLVAIGTKVQNAWKSASNKSGIDVTVGGIPPLSHFTFECDSPLEAKAFFVQEMLKKNFLASTSFYSMYAHSEDDVNRYSNAVTEVFSCLSGAIKSGTLSSKLEGSPSVAGFKRLT